MVLDSMAEFGNPNFHTNNNNKGQNMAKYVNTQKTFKMADQFRDGLPTTDPRVGLAPADIVNANPSLFETLENGNKDVQEGLQVVVLGLNLFIAANEGKSSDFSDARRIQHKIAEHGVKVSENDTFDEKYKHKTTVALIVMSLVLTPDSVREAFIKEMPKLPIDIEQIGEKIVEHAKTQKDETSPQESEEETSAKSLTKTQMEQVAEHLKQIGHLSDDGAKTFMRLNITIDSEGVVRVDDMDYDEATETAVKVLKAVADSGKVLNEAAQKTVEDIQAIFYVVERLFIGKPTSSSTGAKIIGASDNPSYVDWRFTESVNGDGVRTPAISKKGLLSFMEKSGEEGYIPTLEEASSAAGMSYSVINEIKADYAKVGKEIVHTMDKIYDHFSQAAKEGTDMYAKTLHDNKYAGMFNTFLDIVDALNTMQKKGTVPTPISEGFATDFGSLVDLMTAVLTFGIEEGVVEKLVPENK